jgi:hypothetical protein
MGSCEHCKKPSVYIKVGNLFIDEKHKLLERDSFPYSWQSCSVVVATFGCAGEETGLPLSGTFRRRKK